MVFVTNVLISLDVVHTLLVDWHCRSGHVGSLGSLSHFQAKWVAWSGRWAASSELHSNTIYHLRDYEMGKSSDWSMEINKLGWVGETQLTNRLTSEAADRFCSPVWLKERRQTQIPKSKECFMVNQPGQARTILYGCSCLTLHPPVASVPHPQLMPLCCTLTLVPLPYNIQGTVVTGYLTFQDSKNAALGVNEWNPKAHVIALKKVENRDNDIWSWYSHGKTVQTLWKSTLQTSLFLGATEKQGEFPRLFSLLNKQSVYFLAKNTYR